MKLQHAATALVLATLFTGTAMAENMGHLAQNGMIAANSMKMTNTSQTGKVKMMAISEEVDELRQDVAELKIEVQELESSSTDTVKLTTEEQAAIW